MPKVVVVLPAYNAAKTLSLTLAEIPAAYRADIVLVDDASRDNTVELARDAGLRVLVHPRNRGYGGNRRPAIARR